MEGVQRSRQIPGLFRQLAGCLCVTRTRSTQKGCQRLHSGGWDPPLGPWPDRCWPCAFLPGRAGAAQNFLQDNDQVTLPPFILSPKVSESLWGTSPGPGTQRLHWEDAASHAGLLGQSGVPGQTANLGASIVQVNRTWPLSQRPGELQCSGHAVNATQSRLTDALTRGAEGADTDIDRQKEKCGAGELHG